MEIDNIYNMDCLEGMKLIPDGSVDAIICDLPYGTTRNQWDSVIPFDRLWEAYKRVTKPNAAIVLFCQQPFTSALVMSNPDMFRYEWIWIKESGTGFLNANRMPMKIHENVLVFYRTLPIYNPQLTKGKKYKHTSPQGNTSSNYGKSNPYTCTNDGVRQPVDCIEFDREANTFHPTQKPVDIIRYFIRTYTNEGGVVLDNCMGSGTTAIACIKENRHFIGFELSKEYFDKAQKRINAEQSQYKLF